MRRWLMLGLIGGGTAAVVGMVARRRGAPIRPGDEQHPPLRQKALGEQVRREMMGQWPGLTDEDILASDGHVGRLVRIIVQKTGDTQEHVERRLMEIMEKTP